MITNAVFSGYVMQTMSGPILFVQGMHVYARDWVDADADLRYLWWASTNINWAANNLDWAVYNNEWADSASDRWSEGPSFQAVQNTTASVVTGTETSGPVTNTIELLVATGRDVVVPYGYDEDGVLSTTDIATAPFVAVCTVLDKDGAAAIISFPTPPEPSGTADRWSYGTGDWRRRRRRGVRRRLLGRLHRDVPDERRVRRHARFRRTGGQQHRDAGIRARFRRRTVDESQEIHHREPVVDHIGTDRGASIVSRRFYQRRHVGLRFPWTEIYFLVGMGNKRRSPAYV